MSCLTPYQAPEINEGRFLQWTPVSYFLELQEEPIELCEPSPSACVFHFPDETEQYQLPIQEGDNISFIINKTEIDVSSGSLITDIKIAIVHQGVFVANAGYIEDQGGSQYYCYATIPCLLEGCDYQFVFYDNSILPPIPCGIYSGSTLQNIIDDNIVLSQVLDCQLQDFL